MNKTFPVRLLGFGFYWGWLFLVGVSPSPILGDIVSVGGLPFELYELIFRCVFLVLFAFFYARSLSALGKKILAGICMTVGPLSTALLAFSGSQLAVIISAAAIGCVDALMFMMWLCLLGRMRTGGTALLLALSYAIGALIALGATVALTDISARVLAICLPIFSAITFLLSLRYSDAAQASGAPSYEEPSRTKLNAIVSSPFSRIAAALLLYAFSFALYKALSVSDLFPLVLAGPFIQVPACVVLGVLVAIILSLPGKASSKGLSYMFLLIPTLYVLGFCMLLYPNTNLTNISGFLVMFSYNAFEIFILNDFCNFARSRNLNMWKTLTFARLAISFGLLLGWAVSMTPFATAANGFVPVALVTCGCITAVVVSTLIFTNRELDETRFVAQALRGVDRSDLHEERTAATSATTGTAAISMLTTAEAHAQFSAHYELSARETQVASMLLRGRNAHYIAEELVLSEATIKTHTYNIYQKIGVHNRMELLDAYDAYWGAKDN